MDGFLHKIKSAHFMNTTLTFNLEASSDVSSLHSDNDIDAIKTSKEEEQSDDQFSEEEIKEGGIEP